MVSSTSKVKYSPTETQLLRLLPKGGRHISSEELAKKLYRYNVSPFYARNVIVGMMRTLIIKVQKNKEPFRILKTERAGPTPTQYWIQEKRK